MPVPRLQLKLKRELFSRRCENVTNRKVIRLKGGEQAEIKARAAAERINHYLHAPYALGSAVLSTFGVPNIDPRALFCSQLVARAYADVKIAVVPGIEPEKITPGMLATSTRFDDITREDHRNVRRHHETLANDSGGFRSYGLERKSGRRAKLSMVRRGQL